MKRRSHLPWWLELAAAAVARCCYRVRGSGWERLPARGGVLLVANHLSYADPVLLQLACPRRIRFVAYAGLTRNAALGLALRLTRTITLSGRQSLGGFRQAWRALQAGEVVAMFPEGQISRTGQLMRIQRGFALLARRAGVPVVPVCVDGAWGSVFSFSENKFLWKRPRWRRLEIQASAGDPMDPSQATPEAVRRALLDLGAEAFARRKALRGNLAHECVRSLAGHPWRRQLVDRTGGRRVLRAGALLAAAAVLSRHLRRTVLERRVGIVLPSGAGVVIANLAVVCAGKSPVNLNFTTDRAGAAASLRLAGVRTVISAAAMREKFPGFPWPGNTLDLRELFARLGGKRAVMPWLAAVWLLPRGMICGLLELPRTGGDSEAGLLFTSGSDGAPKGVPLSHRNVLANCAQVSSLSILPARARMLACLPLFHSFGFTITLWYPLLRGCGTVTVPAPLDTRKIIDAIREEAATVLVGAPSFIRPLVPKAQAADLRSLQLVVAGAEKLPDELRHEFRRKFGRELMEGYGLTETSPVTNVNQPDPPVTTVTAEPQQGSRLHSVGRLLPGLTVRMVHPETGAELPAGDEGIVCFRGANVFGGYLNDEERNHAAFRDGWFVTGDLGRVDEDGFLFIAGRLSRFSKIGGEMVPHGVIERRIVEVLGWADEAGFDAVVMGVPDAAKGEALVLLTTREVTSGQLREKLLAAGLPGLWIPRLIRRVDAIPVLGTGKLDLKRCREAALAANGPAGVRLSPGFRDGNPASGSP